MGRPELLCLAPDGESRDHRRVAADSNEPLPSPVPLFRLDHPGPVCDFLEERFLGGA
ncbi:MAG: hypothetical protein ACYDA8_01185 [Deferrisomatales bacterium]